ncbi:class I SAM-dependent methyltransferase [Streptomyces sp. NPDC051940]|uniref:class I SAM-dependent methyltransferase n=1 Tax=Streptomyces sp. NPDC051940 TaxID=3155675 RepID=UPI003412D004
MTTKPRYSETHRNTHRALSFDTVAAQYAAARPGYPPALLDAVEDLTGRPLKDADVLDCGAGTGIATRLLRTRGARVVSLEPGAAMAAELRAAEPDAPVVRGDGNALPFAAGTFDLLTYAQAWHWTEPARSVPEALRVLRDDGALALWWNDGDASVDWVAEEEARLDYVSRGFTEDVPLMLAPFPVRVDTRAVAWSRRVSVDDHVRNLGSRSFFNVMEPERRTALLTEARAELLKLFPDGELDEPYVCTLHLVRAR